MSIKIRSKILPCEWNARCNPFGTRMRVRVPRERHMYMRALRVESKIYGVHKFEWEIRDFDAIPNKAVRLFRCSRSRLKIVCYGLLRRIVYQNAVQFCLFSSCCNAAMGMAHGRICVHVNDVVVASQTVFKTRFDKYRSMHVGTTQCNATIKCFVCELNAVAFYAFCFRCRKRLPTGPAKQSQNCNLRSSNECCHWEVLCAVVLTNNWNIVRSKLNCDVIQLREPSICSESNGESALRSSNEFVLAISHTHTTLTGSHIWCAFATLENVNYIRNTFDFVPVFS